LQPQPEAEVVVVLAIQVLPLAAVLQGPMVRLHRATMPVKTEPTNPVTAEAEAEVAAAGAEDKAEPHPGETKAAMLDHMA
jgi:hypothetical protein